MFLPVSRTAVKEMGTPLRARTCYLESTRASEASFRGVCFFIRQKTVHIP